MKFLFGLWFIILLIVTAVLGQTVVYVPDDNPNPPFDQTSIIPTLTITETITDSISSTVLTLTLPNRAVDPEMQGWNSGFLLIVLFVSSLLTLFGW